jgi:hypothetical protein
MAQALVEKGVEDDPSGVVGGVAGSFHGLLTIFPGVTAEVPLGNLSLRGTAEGNAHMFQLIDPPGSILDHDLRDILVAEVITPLDRIEEMPLPVIFFLVAQGRRDPPLGSAGMGTSGVNFADDGYIGLVRAFHSRSQPGQPCSHDDNVMLRNHNSRLSPAMDLQAFSFSLPYFYDKYKAFNYSNAFCGRASQVRFIIYQWPEGSGDKHSLLKHLSRYFSLFPAPYHLRFRVFFDLNGIFCYDSVISGFPLRPFPWDRNPGCHSKLGGTRMRGDQLARQMANHPGN